MTASERTDPGAATTTGDSSSHPTVDDGSGQTPAEDVRSLAAKRALEVLRRPSTDIPYGYCHCGCGEKTSIAASSRAAWGWVRGEPKRFIHTHNGYLKAVDPIVIEEDRGYDSACWIWQGSTNGVYGKARRAGRDRLIHRWIYEQAVGPIPEGLVIDHLCVVALCINPDHLEAVTQAVNVRRSTSPAAIHAAKTHCIRGHAFDAENTALDRGRRVCKTCKRLRDRAAYAAKTRAA